MRRVVPLLLSAVAALSAGCSRDQPGVSKGSPPKEEALVVFRAADGRTLTMADLRGLTGTFRYEILGKDNVPAEAESLHKQARQAGGAGEYKKAITLLERASSLAPKWPYPVYDLAFTYLLMKDAENARKHYRKTVELAPRGFFTAMTALDTLDREAMGDLPAGTYLAYVSLEWMDDTGKKAEVVRQLVKRVPGFAPAWKELAMQADADAEKLAAIEKGLAANPDGETKGILLINKALILDRGGDHDGAVRLLGELALDPASTYATEHLAKVTLANVSKK
jgi:tetratricopeptide (TPR) repeat protein